MTFSKWWDTIENAKQAARVRKSQEPPTMQTLHRKKFEDLKGETINEIRIAYDEVIFLLRGGAEVKLHHEQDCCENVYLHDTAGSFEDILGREILLAEEAESPGPVDMESTWTFYKLGTDKGFVTLRWLGESNGYYSESVDIEWRTPE